MTTPRQLFALPALLLTAVCHAQWTPIATGVGGGIESIDFAGNLGLFSQLGTIARSTDGGNTWTAVATGGGYRDIDWADATTAYAAGVSSTAVYKSVNSGVTWTQVTPVPNSNSLWGVSAPSANRAFLSGTGNVVWRLDGSFFTQVDVDLSPSVTITDVHFTSDQHGCALGETGKVWTTDNGGASWTMTYSGTGSLMQSIYFTSPTRGYAVGTNGRVIRTTDGGDTWTVLNTNSTAHLRSVHFYDDLHGLAVGFTGGVIYTPNGGENWYTLPPPTTEMLRAAYMFGPTSAIVAGEAGVMFRISAIAVGVEEQAATAAPLNAWPNPTVDRLSISLPGDAGSLAQLTVLDALGRSLPVAFDIAPNGAELVLDLRSVPSGSYQAILRTGTGGTYRARFMKVDR